MEFNTFFDTLDFKQNAPFITIGALSIVGTICICFKFKFIFKFIVKFIVKDNNINRNKTITNSYNKDDHSSHTYNIYIDCEFNQSDQNKDKNDYLKVDVLNKREVKETIETAFSNYPLKDKIINSTPQEMQVFLLIKSGETDARKIADILNCSPIDTRHILKNLCDKGLIMHCENGKSDHWQINEKS